MVIFQFFFFMTRYENNVIHNNNALLCNSIIGMILLMYKLKVQALEIQIYNQYKNRVLFYLFRRTKLKPFKAFL